MPKGFSTFLPEAPRVAWPRRSLMVLGASSVPLALARYTSWGSNAALRSLDLSAYRLVFSTEFDDPRWPLMRRNGGAFSTRYDGWGGVRTLPNNKELQLYVDPYFIPSPSGTDAQGRNDAKVSSGIPAGLNPFRVGDGYLTIMAEHTPTALADTLDRPFVSGMISTDESFAQRYGYFEIRAQLPAGQGLWPAFWLVGKTHDYHVEIDVLEALGHECTRIYQTVHPRAPASAQHVPVRLDFDYSAGMHSYGLEWTPDVLTFYVDRQVSAQLDGAPFRDEVPMYMIANLAVGGSWGGSPDRTTRFPAEMRIEHIRAYRLAGDGERPQ